MTVYTVGPLDVGRGRCQGCGCRLQDPDGSVWLAPWHDRGGDCTVCMAHAEDPDALATLRHWLHITATVAAG